MPEQSTGALAGTRSAKTNVRKILDTTLTSRILLLTNGKLSKVLPMRINRLC